MLLLCQIVSYESDEVISPNGPVRWRCIRGNKPKPQSKSEVDSLCSPHLPHFRRRKPYIRSQTIRIVISKWRVFVAFLRFGVLRWVSSDEIFVERVGET
jgi:hypothetical protein